MAPNPRKVAVIVLNWNGGQDTLECLESLQKISYPEYELIVVDNASSDGSYVQIQTHYPHVTLIQSGDNLGYVGGNNVGLEYALQDGSDFALLLNNDTEVAPDFLDRLVDGLESDPAAGIAGPSIYYFSQPDVFWSAGGAIDWKNGSTSMIGIGERDRGQFGAACRAVDFITGCALLIRMDVVQKIGLLDQRFFAYYEETEWCVRAQRAGYNSLHIPGSKIWHKISPVAREASPVVHYYMTRNRLLFLKLAHAGWRPVMSTLIEYAGRLLSWTIKPRWRGKRPQRKAMVRAILDYRHGRFGRAG
jgi:GT2 family glycosyltransferase